MKSKAQSGFTLIELVMVVAILGVLAATALPKFIDMKSDASDAALKGVAGALTAASSTNFAARTANSTKGAAVADCQDVAGLLQGGLPSGYSITQAAITAGASSSCTLTQTDTSSTSTFTALGIS